MCHTELALKKKCNCLDWRHRKSFQIYLQDNLELILQPLVSGRKQNSVEIQMLQYGKSVMTWCSKFFVKNCASSTCSSEEFSSNKNRSIITPDFRPLQRGWFFHSCHCFCDKEQTPFFWLTGELAEEGKNQSLSVSFSLPWLWRKAGWAGFNLFLGIFSSVESSMSIFLDSPCSYNTELSICGV